MDKMDKKLDRIESLLLTVLTKIDHIGHQVDKNNERIINIEKDVYRLKLNRVTPSAPPPQPRLHLHHTQHCVLPVLNPYYKHKHLSSPHHRGTPQHQPRQHTHKHSTVSIPDTINRESPTAAVHTTLSKDEHHMDTIMDTGSCDGVSSGSWTDMDSDEEVCDVSKPL